jgi:hypothetical protein
METLNFVRVATKAKDNADGFLYIHNWATGWQELIFHTKEEAALWVNSLNIEAEYQACFGIGETA